MIHNYAALAPLYDRIMAHVEYDEWVSYINKIIALYCDASRPALLEIGGGTGFLGRKLIDHGMNYRGSDFSYSMCLQARGRGVPFFTADARFLPCKPNSFDMAFFLYDGINYLQSMDEYHMTSTQAHAYLRPGGLFLFDITTQTNSLNNFNEFYDTGDYDDHFFFRRSYYHADSTTQYNDFTIFSKTGDLSQAQEAQCVYYKFREHHAQKVFPADMIAQAIPDGLFEVLGIWDGFSFKRHNSRSERVHFLMKKKSR
jgi:SAM-dependent methyltransferase